MRYWLILLLLVLGNMTGRAEELRPLLHAHNDYEHRRPLLEAFTHGFDSVEADVVQVGDTLFVAHEPEGFRPRRTLETLYLNNLAILHEAGALTRPMYLMIDIKSDPDSTWAVLEPLLARHRKLLREARVTVLLSGNLPQNRVAVSDSGLAKLDGRLEDLDRGVSPGLYPWISVDWNDHFFWRGEGEMPLVEESKLEAMVKAVHSAGHLIRFWGTDDSFAPNRRAMWRNLRDAGVDVINTDDLKGVAAFRKRGR